MTSARGEEGVVGQNLLGEEEGVVGWNLLGEAVIDVQLSLPPKLDLRIVKNH